MAPDSNDDFQKNNSDPPGRPPPHSESRTPLGSVPRIPTADDKLSDKEAIDTMKVDIIQIRGRIRSS